MVDVYKVWKNIGDSRMLRSMSYDHVYNKGIKLARADAVLHIKIDIHEGKAIVQDKEGEHTAIIRPDDDIASCDCGQVEHGFACEHIIAMMAYIHDNVHFAIEREQKRHDAIDSIMAPYQKRRYRSIW